MFNILGYQESSKWDGGTRSSQYSKVLSYFQAANIHFGVNAYWVPTSPEAFTGAKREKNADSLLVEN